LKRLLHQRARPEPIGVAGVVALGAEAHVAAGRDHLARLVQVLAQIVVVGDADALVFEEPLERRRDRRLARAAEDHALRAVAPAVGHVLGEHLAHARLIDAQPPHVRLPSSGAAASPAR
jgi:hypothetical protein